MTTNLLDTSLEDDYTAPIDVDAAQAQENAWAIRRIIELSEERSAGGKIREAKEVFADLRKMITQDAG
jgi:hypothetical protein